MNDPLALSKVVTLCLKLGWQEAIKRLESVQGPELGLVGESRSARKQGTAEEVKPGERGVGEIVELAKLQRHIDSRIEEARLASIVSAREGWHSREDFADGQRAALTDLLWWLSDTAEKRSDLSNDEMTSRQK